MLFDARSRPAYPVEYPRSKASALYQIIVSFLILVTVSAYTANLAAFITLSAQPALSALSLDDVMINGKSACSYAANPQLVTYDEIYPRLRYTVLPRSEVRDKLISGTGCDAAILPRITYDTFRMSEAACNMRIAQTVFPGQAGWVTNRQSPCLQQAFEWALNGLELTGRVGKLYLKWLPEAMCSLDENEAESEAESEAGRRMDAAGGAKLAAPAAVRPRRRRLSAAGGGSGGGDDDVGKMELLDFIGVFAIWGTATVIVVTVSCLEKLYGTRLRRLQAALAKKAERTGGAIVDTVEAIVDLPEGEQESPEEAHERHVANEKLKALKINMNDETGMVRALLLQVLEMREGLSSERKEEKKRRLTLNSAATSAMASRSLANLARAANSASRGGGASQEGGAAVRSFAAASSVGKSRQGGEHFSARLTEASAVRLPADNKTAMDYDQAHSPFKTTFIL